MHLLHVGVGALLARGKSRRKHEGGENRQADSEHGLSSFFDAGRNAIAKRESEAIRSTKMAWILAISMASTEL
jgi:hypothetical protein